MTDTPGSSVRTTTKGVVNTVGASRSNQDSEIREIISGQDRSSPGPGGGYDSLEPPLRATCKNPEI